MTERLEEIKSNWYDNDTIEINEVPWLIQQAERVEELEKKLNIATERGAKLAHKNVSYKQALEDVLQEAYEEAGVHPDSGMQLETYIVKRIRKALEREGNG